MHPHKNMEILTYVIDGALQHKDNMGNGSVIRAGQFQKMSAGTGVTHSEFNPSPDAPTHLYQVWIQPNREGIAPSYAEHPDSVTFDDNAWNLIAAPNEVGAFPLAQDARVYLGRMDAGVQLDFAITDGRHVWIQVVSGSITPDDQILGVSDGIAIEREESISLIAMERSEVMLFDLA
jgi:redox-sensitive bicupin YhaK (pirin superfamily)